MDKSEKQQKAPSTKRQIVGEIQNSRPFAFLMRNSNVTPLLLFILALAPLVITALIVTLVFVWQ